MRVSLSQHHPVLHGVVGRGGLEDYFIGAAYCSSWVHCFTIGTLIANRCFYNCDKKVII
jgi:hypothetical protein